MSHLFKSPFYFLFCASFGFAAWSFTFQSELNDANYFANLKVQQSNFSSTADESKIQVDDDGSQIKFDENGEAVADEDVIKELELSKEEWLKKSEDPYSTSPDDVERYETIVDQSYGEKNKFVDFLQIAAEAPVVQYEDEKKCGTARLGFDSLLKKSTLLTDLIKENSDSPIISRKCLIHVMSKFNLSSNSMARCPKGLSSAPLRGGTKPCISKALVNATYNSFVDITTCLGVNPKSLLPKLSNESGMLVNTLGGGLDAGVGQLTRIAIEETNKYYDSFMSEIESNAVTKPSCARILKFKPALAKISEAAELRCGLIASPENPLKNILYMTMLNRINLNTARRKFENNDIVGKFSKIGLEKINVEAAIEMVALASYNAGPATAFNALNEYLDKRIKIGKKISTSDFDFKNPKTEKDIDGIVKPVTKIARLFVNSPFIKVNDPDKKIKSQRAKVLPDKIRSAHLLTFPEYMIYNQNNFDESQKTVTKEYKTIGAPGYLGFLADKDTALRQTFEESGASPDYCSNPNFLKIK